MKYATPQALKYSVPNSCKDSPKQNGSNSIVY